MAANGKKPDWGKLRSEDEGIGLEEDLLDIVSGAVGAFLKDAGDDEALLSIERCLALGEQLARQH